MFLLDRLGSVNEYEAGEGTFVKDNIIYSSILGSKVISKADCRSRPDDLFVASKPLISIQSIRSLVVPDVGDIVLARVIMVTLRLSYDLKMM